MSDSTALDFATNWPTLRAVVTGASSGIGQAIAIQLAKRAAPGIGSGESGSEGSRVLVHYRRNRTGAESTAEQIRLLGVAAEIVSADLRESSDRELLVSRAWEFLERPTTWVNNAGADVLTGEMQDKSFDEKLACLFETDVLGTIALSRSVAKRMRMDAKRMRMDTKRMRADVRQQQEGSELPPSITFIGWDQAPLGMEGDAGQMFGPTKAAVMAFANSLAQEVAPHIRVNTVAPGWIQTKWGESTSGYWDQRAREQSLMNRWGRPEDVASAVCFLADPANTFCSGQTINLNGGWNRRFADYH